MKLTRTGDDEHGFTVIELAIVTLISSLLLGSIVGILDNQTKAEQRLGAVADNQELVRQTLVALQRDIRSADHLVAPAEPATATRQIDLVQVDFDSGAATELRWRLDPMRSEIVREEIADGQVVATSHRISGVRDQVLLQYFDAVGFELVPGHGTSASLASCTVRIRVHVAAAPTAGPAPLAVSSDVELRNRRRANPACAT